MRGHGSVGPGARLRGDVIEALLVCGSLRARWSGRLPDVPALRRLHAKLARRHAQLVEQLRAMVGVANAPEVARDPVNQAMIRHWCDAMRDANPVYTDPDFAAKSIHGGIVAPPAMLNAWTMPGLPGRRGNDPSMNPMRALDAAGFTSVIATNSEHEYVRYLRLGDHVRGTPELVDVSEEKQTALGLGPLRDVADDLSHADGEEVGRMFFRLLKFRPGTGAPRRRRPWALRRRRHAARAPPRPPRRETTLRFAEVREGEALAPCAVPITTTLIVAAALASRDYQDVHHDRDAAIRRGTPDIFMNILTSSGLVARYVTDWAGPEAILDGAAHPARRAELPGRHDAARGARGEGRRRARRAGDPRRNRLGDHVTGTVELRLA